VIASSFLFGVPRVGAFASRRGSSHDGYSCSELTARGHGRDHWHRSSPPLSFVANLSAAGYRHPRSPSATTTIEGNQLPPPPQKFEGKIERNAAGSTPYWPARVVPPKGAPNVLLIMTDDTGFGVSSTFGGVIPTPNLDRVAANGLRYTNFNSTALCSPTRAALITGRNHHSMIAKSKHLQPSRTWLFAPASYTSATLSYGMRLSDVGALPSRYVWPPGVGHEPARRTTLCLKSPPLRGCALAARPPNHG
jgi:Sulfatase